MELVKGVGAGGRRWGFRRRVLLWCCRGEVFPTGHERNTSEICLVLGISDNTSRSFDFPSVKKSKRHQAQGCTDESTCNNMDIEVEGHDVICNCASSLHRTSDPALLVVDVFWSCHPTKIARCENFPSVMRSFSDLLDQLRGVSLVVLAAFWGCRESGSLRGAV